jgi:hypothetical protein
MSLADDFRGEMAQSITVQAVSSSGLYGPSYGAAVTYSCYVKFTVQNIIDSEGHSTITSMQIYLDGHPGITETSKINYGSRSPKILKIARPFDEDGGAYATIIYTENTYGK